MQSQEDMQELTDRFDVSWTFVLSYSRPRARPGPAICQNWQNPGKPGLVLDQPGRHSQEMFNEEYLENK